MDRKHLEKYLEHIGGLIKLSNPDGHRPSDIFMGGDHPMNMPVVPSQESRVELTPEIQLMMERIGEYAARDRRGIFVGVQYWRRGDFEGAEGLFPAKSSSLGILEKVGKVCYTPKVSEEKKSGEAQKLC